MIMKTVLYGIARRFYTFANHYILSTFEIFLRKKSHESIEYPPIFIIGAPRSGSTLLIQAIVSAFDIGYISNCHCKLYGAPALAEKLFCSTQNRKKSTFESLHGTTKSSEDPSECGKFWYRFFRKNPIYVQASDISPQDLNRFSLSVKSLMSTIGKPFVFKNMYASLRIQPILNAFPNACFIITERDEVDNAHSLLVTRNNVYGNYDQWWSMEPPNIDELINLPATVQVLQQIRSIHKTIMSDLAVMNVPDKQVIRMSYEELCEHPNLCMSKLSEFFAVNNIQVHHVSQLPDYFTRDQSVNVPIALYQELVDNANKP